MYLPILHLPRVALQVARKIASCDKALRKNENVPLCIACVKICPEIDRLHQTSHWASQGQIHIPFEFSNNVNFDKMLNIINYRRTVTSFLVF